MEGTTAPEPTAGSMPLADDDDDSELFIEAPVLPEPPEVEEDDLALPLENEPLPTSAPEDEDVVGSGLTGFDRAFEAEPGLAPPRIAPEPVAEIQVEPAHTPLEANATGAAEPAGEPAPALPEAAPVPESEPSAPPVDREPPPSKRTGKADPLAALAGLKMDTRRLTTKPKAVDHRVNINSLMGELTQAGRGGLPTVLRMDVPPALDGHEVEVVVQLRRQGQVVAEGTIHQSLPGKGSTSKLSVEFKRS
jgi:hypothetical protein